MSVTRTVVFLLAIILSSCGGGGSQNTDSGAIQSESGDNTNDQQVNENTELEQETENTNPQVEVELSIGEVLASEDYPADGTGGSALDSLQNFAISNSNIAFSASFASTDGDRSGLWIGDIDDPKLVLTSGAPLPIPSEDNQYIDAISLEYFDDGVLGVFFERGDGTGYMTIDETSAFVVAATGITLEGVLEPRTITGIERVAHAGTRNVFVGRTDSGFSAVLWQVDGTAITPIASTASSDFGVGPRVESCDISLLARNSSALTPGLASRDIPNIGLTESGATLFMAELSGSTCSEPGVDIVRFENGIYSRMRLSGPFLSLGEVFSDGSFVFGGVNGLMIRTASGDIVDIADPSLLAISQFESVIDSLTVEAWIDRPASLSIDTQFRGEVEAVGSDGSVVFTSSFFQDCI